MKNILTYSDYNKVNEEFRLFPSDNDTIKKDLSFLIDTNLDTLRASVNKKEIKDIMLKVDKAMKNKKVSLSSIIENADIHLVQNMLDILKEIKKNLLEKDKTLGNIVYLEDSNKFHYNPGFVI